TAGRVDRRPPAPGPQRLLPLRPRPGGPPSGPRRRRLGPPRADPPGTADPVHRGGRAQRERRAGGARPGRQLWACSTPIRLPAEPSPPAEPGRFGPVVLEGRAVRVYLVYGHVGDPVARVYVVFRSLAGRLVAVGVSEEDVRAGALVLD